MVSRGTATSSTFFLSTAFFRKVFEVSLTFSRVCRRARRRNQQEFDHADQAGHEGSPPCAYSPHWQGALGDYLFPPPALRSSQPSRQRRPVFQFKPCALPLPPSPRPLPSTPVFPERARIGHQRFCISVYRSGLSIENRGGAYRRNASKLGKT